ncbi:MAG: 1-acyl-sn-glycerol-3-phosphate acyltransferase [Hyphomonadaceae bacterium]
MRSFLFAIAYWSLSVVYALTAVITLILPGRAATTFLIRSYTRAMRHALRFIAGIRTSAYGHEHLPETGAYIVAAKHQSWGDGFMSYSEIPGLVFVTGDHLEKLPLLGGIIKKLGAIVIDTCGGGHRKAASLSEGIARTKANGDRVLIYPEGHLAPVDHKMRYKAGVWHMYEEMQVAVVPVATNLGLFWAQTEHKKTKGHGVIEFLEPIQPGLAKDEFMVLLETRIETRTAELVAEARGTAPVEAILLPDPNKGTAAKPEHALSSGT